MASQELFCGSQQRREENKLGKCAIAGVATLYLFDSTEYHNLYHFQFRDYQRSPEVKEKVDKIVRF